MVNGQITRLRNGFLTSNQKHEFGYLLNKQNEKLVFSTSNEKRKCGYLLNNLKDSIGKTGYFMNNQRIFTAYSINTLWMKEVIYESHT